MGTPVQVVNKPGAASQVAMTQLVAAQPTGYTLSYGVLPTIITHYLDPDRTAPYTRKNFQPVAHHHLVPAMLAVMITSPYQSLQNLVNAAKANPDKITISDSGLMGNPHLAVLMLQRAAGVRFASVHFPGGAPSVTALLGGHVEVLAGGVSDATANVKAGKFRVLGIASEGPNAFLPGVATMKAQGFDVVSVSATGILAPAGTPREVVDILTRAMKKVIDTEDHQKKLADLGVTAHYLGPDDYAAFWVKYEERVGEVMKTIKAK
jgi:tripartite-type tricarboxylate transporter receptor subunit TctC